MPNKSRVRAMRDYHKWCLYKKKCLKSRSFGGSFGPLYHGGPGASWVPCCLLSVPEVRSLPGRNRGSSDGVRRKRSSKTPGEMEATVAKKARKMDAARNAKRQDEKAARRSMLDSLRRDGSEGPSVAPAATGGTAGPSTAASDGAPSSVGPSHPFQSIATWMCR